MLENIKICGIKNQSTLNACINIKVGFIGFNFVPKSPRFILPKEASSLKAQLPETIKSVALIVDENDTQIQHIINYVNPNYLQLHGYETIERIQDIKQKFNIPIIKAIGIADKKDIQKAETYFNYTDILLLDTKSIPNNDLTANNLTGGSGKQFDWSLVNQLTQRPKPIMLAGGLNKDNIKQAQKTTSANFYDICSGVESNKGVKSTALIKDLISL